MKKILSLCFIVFLGLSLADAANSRDRLSFVENKGQWEDVVRFKSEFRGGALFFEESAITFLMQNPDDLESFRSRKFADPSDALPDPIMRMYAYRLRFKGANPNVQIFGMKPFSDYYNFYLGNDPSRWKSQVPVFHSICYKQLYEGVDLYYTSVKSSYKYEFHLQPHVAPEQIAMQYEGTDYLRVKEGNLYIGISDYETVELKPFAYQESENGEKEEIECRFIVKNNKVSFRLGKYDPGKALVIDPVMVFCSYTGSYADNWGYSATYDKSGNMYGGGVAFGSGYPVTLGAFQVNYALGGSCDISITKYSADGTTIIYSTYLGGTGSEVPHSLVVNDNDELYVLASTSSDDFPVTSQGFDTLFSYTTSPTHFVLTNTIYYVGGMDIAIAKFDASGSRLMGSTYFGGSGFDGLSTDVGLRKNYADEVRGEIMVDAYSNVYVVSSTASADLPVTSGAFQRQYGGGRQDGCVAKFSYDLQHLIWCSYLGGDSSDALYSMVLDKNSNLYVCGGTKSRNLPVTSSVVQNSYGGGVSDGFVANISTNGNQLKALTYYGKEGYDQTYLIKMDQAGYVYVMGLTDATGMTWVSNAQWYVSGGGQFISKLNPHLTKVKWSTAFGSGQRTGPDLSPTALMVDLCGHIYFSGWGSPAVNAHVGNTNCGTRGLPLSTNALKLITDNNDFYFLTLDANASNLLFGSFFGGFASSDHVDGGTSRFDRKGCIYQAICSSCGGVNDMPVTSNAAARNNNSANCNLCVVKIDFNIMEVVADFSMPNVVCAPYLVLFKNSSKLVSDSTTSFFWDFGDGTSSTQKDPTHYYAQSGTYTVRLIVSDTSSCNGSDTLMKDLLVLSNSMDTLPDRTICKGDFVQIGIQPANSSNVTYSWFPSTGLSSTDISNPIAFDTVSRTYYMTITDGNCVDTLRVRVNVMELAIDSMPDLVHLCQGDSLHVYPQTDDSVTFQWSTNIYFLDTINSSLNSPELHLGNAMPAMYYLRMKNDNCVLIDSLKVLTSVLKINPFKDDTVCMGDSVCYKPSLVFSLGDTLYYQWQTQMAVSSDTNSSEFCLKVVRDGDITLNVSNQVGCYVSDTFHIVADSLSFSSIVKNIRCYGTQDGSIELFPQSGFAPFQYIWSPKVSQNSYASNLNAGDYVIEITDAQGCRFVYKTAITEPAPIKIGVLDSNLQTFCDSLCVAYIDLQLTGGVQPYEFSWNTGDTGLSLHNLCVGTYKLTVYDSNRCSESFTFSVWDTADFNISMQLTDVSCYGLCDGVVLLAPHGVAPYTYKWKTGQTTRYEQNLCAGVYDILVEDARHCRRRLFPALYEPLPLVFDSINVKIPVCNGESTGFIEAFVSGGTSGNYSFFWNGVAGGSRMENLPAGSYHLRVTDSNGCDLDTLIVLKEFDSIICIISSGKVPCKEVCNATASSFVQGGGAPYRYQWDNGDTNSFTEGLCYGEHALTVTDSNQCSKVFSFFVNDSSSFSQSVQAWASQYYIYAGEKTTLCMTDFGPGFTYQWSPPEGLSATSGICVEAQPFEDVIYEAHVLDTFGCMLTDTVGIIVEHIVCDEPYVFVPNSFTPNGDGLNDILYVRGEVVESLYFAIYDRWGECVFETDNQLRGWDGTYKGKACDQGVYVFYLEVNCFGKLKNLIKGNVTLIR